MSRTGLFVLTILTCYYLFNAFGFIIGMARGNQWMCGGSWQRFEYIAPGFRIGCWFGEVK